MSPALPQGQGLVWTLHRVCPRDSGGEMRVKTDLTRDHPSFSSQPVFLTFLPCSVPSPATTQKGTNLVCVGGGVHGGHFYHTKGGSSCSASFLLSYPPDTEVEAVRNSAVGLVTWVQKLCDLDRLLNLSEPR